MKTMTLPEQILLFFFVGIWPGFVLADNRADSAQVYFAEGQYQEALDIWYDLVSSGKATSGTYYNIGLAESRLNHLPMAMLAFEKARRLRPFNKAVKAAIIKEREKIVDGVIPVRPFFLVEWYRGYLALFRPGYWTFIGLMLMCLGGIYFVRRNLKPTNTRPFPSRSEMAIAIGGLVFLISGFLSYASLYRGDEAILQVQCEVKKAPSEESPSMITIHPGEKLVIRDQLAGWYNVRLLNLEEGWVRKDCLIRIRMEEGPPSKG